MGARPGGLTPVAGAATIVKLSLGGDATSDVEFDGTIFGTIDDGNILTAGHQDTSIEYADFLAFLPDSNGSFTLGGLAVTGAPTVVGSVVIQSFTGGTFELYESPTNLLLLSGSLSDSVLTGTVGSPGTAALFTTSFGSFTGGTLAPLLVVDSLTLSMAMNDVFTSGTSGLSVVGGALQPFVADGSVLVGGIPEPGSVVLAGLAFAGLGLRRRRR